MSFLDKAKEKATQLTAQVKEKVDDTTNKRKADDLLDDIGRIVYRQRTSGVVGPDDDSRVDAIVVQLKALADLGTSFMETETVTAPPVSTLPPPGAPTTMPLPEPAPMPYPEPGN